MASTHTYTLELEVTPDDETDDETEVTHRLADALAYSTAREALEQAMRGSVELRLVKREYE